MSAGGYLLAGLGLAVLAALAAWQHRVALRIRDELREQGTSPSMELNSRWAPTDLAVAAVAASVGAVVLVALGVAKLLL